jgi:hypothetical protein
MNSPRCTDVVIRWLKPDFGDPPARLSFSPMTQQWARGGMTEMGFLLPTTTGNPETTAYLDRVSGACAAQRFRQHGVGAARVRQPALAHQLDRVAEGHAAHP